MFVFGSVIQWNDLFPMQFKLRTMLLAAFAVAIAVAYLANPSLVTMTVLLVGCNLFVVFNLKSWWKFPTLVGGAVGVCVASVFMFLFVLHVVIEAPRVQGQLYDEDGPIAFFLVAGVLWLIACIGLGLIGTLVGLLVECSFCVLNWIASEKQGPECE